MEKNKYYPIGCEHKFENGLTAYTLIKESKGNFPEPFKIVHQICSLCSTINVIGYRGKEHIDETIHICIPEHLNYIIKYCNFMNVPSNSYKLLAENAADVFAIVNPLLSENELLSLGTHFSESTRREELINIVSALFWYNDYLKGETPKNDGPTKKQVDQANRLINNVLSKYYEQKEEEKEDRLSMARWCYRHNWTYDSVNETWENLVTTEKNISSDELLLIYEQQVVKSSKSDED